MITLLLSTLKSGAKVQLITDIDKEKEIYLGENGETGPLDMIGLGVNELRENIVDENMYVHCNICKEVFPAKFNDEGFVEIKKEEE